MMTLESFVICVGSSSPPSFQLFSPLLLLSALFGSSSSPSLNIIATSISAATCAARAVAAAAINSCPMPPPPVPQLPPWVPSLLPPPIMLLPQTLPLGPMSLLPLPPVSAPYGLQCPHCCCRRPVSAVTIGSFTFASFTSSYHHRRHHHRRSLVSHRLHQFFSSLPTPAYWRRRHRLRSLQDLL